MTIMLKTGKTTLATKFPKHLLIAFERGYNALPNAMAQPVNNWSEFLTILQQLKKPEVKEKFSNIVIDTGDIAYDYCENFICMKEGKDRVAEIPYGEFCAA